jgi:sulfatase modifying factor 1
MENKVNLKHKFRKVMKIRTFKNVCFILAGLALAFSCAKERSSATGWEFNDYKNGGFEKFDAKEQETGPGLVLVEGGTFTMGQTEQDVMFDWNARAARVSVASFYMDRTEVTNFHWLEYMYWMKRVYYKSYPHVYKKCLPDTLAWRKALGYREKYVNYYLRHPSYRDYPVVGVSWLQANDFCKWRTDRVNEAILVREGIINWHFAEASYDVGGDVGAANQLTNPPPKTPPGQKPPVSYDRWMSSPQNMFSTENYLNGTYVIENGGRKYNKNTGQYDPDKSNVGGYSMNNGSGVTVASDGPLKGKAIPRDPYQLENFDPVYADADNGRLGSRPVKLEDGILLPNYRLPTEAEWEFAALGLKGNLDPNSENIDERRIYPWDGHYVRQEEQQFAGAIQANFMRGKGDVMGIAGNLNDGGDITVRVDDFWPNDYGLYHMAGNVSEWVMDVYRPLSSEVFEEFMPFRGNVYKTQMKVPDGLYDKPVKANENIYDVLAMKEFVNEYARVLYLANSKKDLNLNNPYSSNYSKKTKSNPLDGFKFEINTDKDTITLTGDTTVLRKNKQPIEWDLSDITGKATLAPKYKVSDTIIKLVVLVPSKFQVKLKQGNTVSNSQSIDTKDPIVNSTPSKVQINSRQDPRKYKYNSPNSGFIANFNEFTKNDSIQFTVLDDINAILDTAIYLQNKGNATKASHYLEVALFGGIEKSNKNILVLSDFRAGAADVELEFGSIRDTSAFNSSGNTDNAFSIFGRGKKGLSSKSDYDHYLGGKFNNYDQDPNITTWILTLRNGLTEFVTETKGNQRWRNVTIEENKDRLNYRKDDYIDYLDGDLESSIYYNNKKKIEDINAGKRDPKQVMYQSKYENKDMDGGDLADGSSGWPTTLISDKSRVYKGGSWADRAYWMSPGNRRFLDEDQSSDMIGFRCAMDRIGSSRPNRKKQ